MSIFHNVQTEDRKKEAAFLTLQTDLSFSPVGAIILKGLRFQLMNMCETKRHWSVPKFVQISSGI